VFLGSLSGTTLIKQHSNDLYISHLFVDILTIWESCALDKFSGCQTSIIWALLSRPLPTIVAFAHIQELTHLFGNYIAQRLSNFWSQSNIKLLGWSNWAPNSDGVIIGPYQHKLWHQWDSVALLSNLKLEVSKQRHFALVLEFQWALTTNMFITPLGMDFMLIVTQALPYHAQYTW
jgi:hypothetical protein